MSMRARVVENVVDVRADPISESTHVIDPLKRSRQQNHPLVWVDTIKPLTEKVFLLFCPFRFLFSEKVLLPYFENIELPAFPMAAYGLRAYGKLRS
jgi:hypothetical protein